MDPMPPFTMTPFLRAAAEHRIEELNREKESFKRRYHLDARRSAEPSPTKRIESLLEDIKKLDPGLEADDDNLTIVTATRYIEQAQGNTSISESRLLKFEKQIWNLLDRHLNRLEVSSLHVDLMKEAMDADSLAESVAAKLEKATIDDDFEMVGIDLEELFNKFEREAFTEVDVDVGAIETYLSGLFVGEQVNEDLQTIRSEMQDFGNQLMENNLDVDQDGLVWTIMDLLKNDLISPEKKKMLEGYLQSPIALRELVATLNMKAYRHWNFKNAQNGLSVSARQNAEGEYCITVEEDIVDMLFLHCTAIGWAGKLKGCLGDFARNSNVFDIAILPMEDMNKREYFLLRQDIKPKARTCTCNVCHSFEIPPHVPMPPPPERMFPPPPPEQMFPPPAPRPSPGRLSGSCNPGVVTVDPLGRKPKAKKCKSSLPPPPPFSTFGRFGTVDTERRKSYLADFFMSRLPVHEGCTPSITCLEEVQINLIKTLAVEAKLGKVSGGKSHGFAASFESLASELPHKTVLTVLKFLGVPQPILDFLTRFLEAKLNIGPAVEGNPDRILTRARGVSAGHRMELFFSEAVLFFLDLVVRQKIGSYLYRLYDQCYYIGTAEQRSQCIEQITAFASVMGLPLRKPYSTGHRLTIGCLTMDPLSMSSSITGDFAIDNMLVDAYARRVKTRLSSCITVLDWIRVWNSTVGVYAAHLFGPIINAFGKKHFEAVKVAYSRIFSIVLDGGDLTTHVQNLLKMHIKRSHGIPPFSLEAIIYLPQSYGGLGVKNPFISLNLANKISENPDAEIDKYLETEEAYYNAAAENYLALSPEVRQQKIEAVFDDNTDRMNASLGPNRDLSLFMTRAELTAHRECAPFVSLPPASYPTPFVPAPVPRLINLYYDLHNEPVDDIDDIEVGDKVSEYIGRLGSDGDMKPLHKLSGQDRWVLQMYADECFERYGTLEIWWSVGVPVEVYKVVRGHVWDEEDDDDESSSFTGSDV